MSATRALRAILPARAAAEFALAAPRVAFEAPDVLEVPRGERGACGVRVHLGDRPIDQRRDHARDVLRGLRLHRRTGRARRDRAPAPARVLLEVAGPQAGLDDG